MRPSKQFPSAECWGEKPQPCGCNELGFELGGDFWYEFDRCAKHQAEMRERVKLAVRRHHAAR